MDVIWGQTNRDNTTLLALFEQKSLTCFLLFCAYLKSKTAMKKEEKFPFLKDYKTNYLTQRIGALTETANAIDLTALNEAVNIKLLKQLKKELNEILRFSKSNLK